jgi:UDP-GlcNAc:undecaprenyl-phosphate/decaprenyl-phosphate GlcNAc-1-phosphate transferase
MNTYLLLFTTALALSLILTPLVRRLCVRRGWLDLPHEERRIHAQALPRLGGVAVYLATLAALPTLLLLNNSVTWSLSANRRQLLVVLVPASLVFLLGVYDDLRGAKARVKFIGQGLAASLFYALGGRIEVLSVPLLGAVKLPVLVGFLVTVLWVVMVTNAFNLIDGIDGLAAGAALFSAFVMIVISVVLGHPFVAVLALVLAGALTGFLRYNFNPASIFLGDSGSLFIGFLLAALSVLGVQKASTAVAIAIPLMAFGLPIADTCFAVVRRFISQRPLFGGDREHIHHMLLKRGWSQRRAALVLYGVCALCGLWALLFARDAGVGRTTGLGLFIAGVALVLAVERLHYHEVDELRDTLKLRLSLTERRLRTAHNIRIRRASQAVAQAKTLNEMFCAVEELLSESEFAGAFIRLGCGDAARNRRALEHEAGAPNLRRAELRNGCICWSWERDGCRAAEMAASSRFWSLRLPLLTTRAGWGEISFYRANDGQALRFDINCLYTLFERELARAAERVLMDAELQAQTTDLKPVAQERALRAGV